MPTQRAAKAARAESRIGQVQAGTARTLPEDLTVTIGLLIKKEYEQRIAKLEARVKELEEASVADVQIVLWEELFTADVVREPLAATKELMYFNEGWLTLDMLFNDAMLSQLGPVSKEAEIYEYLVKDFSDHPRAFMIRYFHYEPPDSDEEEEEEDDED